MTEQFLLTKAPIKEAVIDIQVAELDIPVDKLKFDLSGFGLVSDIRTTEMALSMGGEEVQTQSSRHHLGFRHETESGKEIAQVTKRGVAISRLAPYKDWESFLMLAKGVWCQYLGVLPDAIITRLAVRYINSLNVPFESGVVNFEDYLRNAPQMPEGFGDKLDHFLARLVLTLDDPPDTTAVINQTIGSERETHLPLILDIDVFTIFQDALTDQQAIWSTLGKLRLLKNRIFFNTMTEKALELCR